jgi:hypothetical protein
MVTFGDMLQSKGQTLPEVKVETMKEEMKAKKPRLLSDIAWEIVRLWAKPKYSAVPYMRAMTGLSTMDDSDGADDARKIVRYFLGNAAGWRGDDARRIKAELREMLK